MKNPFWENSYKDNEVTTFGAEANITIQERYSLFEKNGIVIDVGCGEGKNALFLASKGFRVDAFDISEPGIEKLKRLAAENHFHASNKIVAMKQKEQRRQLCP